MKLYHIAKRFRIDKPDKFRLSKHDPAECCGLTVDKKEAQAMLADGIERLSELQQRLYADDRWSVLIVLQAMDAAGKDSIIKHVMSGINPQGCEVHSFKQPSAEELQHDFLWRVAQRLPTNGRIGIFNRSHYEEVLTVRVHKELLARQKLPKQLVGKDIWQQRFDDIRAFERHLARNGTLILKFFLNVSKDEQRKPFPRPHRRAGQALEIFHGRRRRAQALGQIHGRLRGHDPANQHAGGALVRGAGRPQMVRAHGGGGGAWCRNCRRARPRLSEGRGQGAQGTAQGGKGAEGARRLT